MSEIGREIVDGVNWVVVFYVIFALCVLILANRFAGFDVLSIFKTLGQELTELSKRKVTYGAINMAGLIVIAGVVVLSMASDSFADIISYAFALKEGQNVPDDNSMFMSMGVLGLFALTSIIVVRVANGK